MHRPRRPTHGASGRRRILRRLRPLLALALWPLLASTTASTYRSLVVEKLMNGKAAPSPEGSTHVQVREHRVLGYRVTEVVLGRAAIDAELPLVVRFHGRSSRPHIPSGDFSAASPVRLMLPWAPEKLGDGFTWFPLSVTERKHRKVLGHYVRERADEFAKVLAFFLLQRPTRTVDGPGGEPSQPRALVAGFSQGGIMAFALALRHPALIEAAFPMAGWLPEFFVNEAVTPKVAYPPIRAIHGRGDPVVPAEPAVRIVDMLRDLGLDATIELFPWDEHSTSAEMWARHEEHMREFLEPAKPPAAGPLILG